MSRYIACLTAALLAGMIAFVTSFHAQAAPASAFSPLTSAIEVNSGGLKLAGYYGNYRRRDYNDDDYRDNGDDDGYDNGDNDDNYDNGHDYNGGHSCGYQRYHKKYVCEQSVPRCFKQRECVWYYGREYCRYVKKCVGGHDKYCKWIKVPVHGCW